MIRHPRTYTLTPAGLAAARLPFPLLAAGYRPIPGGALRKPRGASPLAAVASAPPVREVS